MENPLCDLIPDDANVVIEQSKWGKVVKPQTIGTLALGPCIGIALFNQKLFEAHVGHFVSPVVEASDVEAMFESALAGCKSADVKAWVRGGRKDGDAHAEEIAFLEKSRAYVVDLLAKLKITDADIEWNYDETEGYVDLIVDSLTGNFKAITQSF